MVAQTAATAMALNLTAGRRRSSPPCMPADGYATQLPSHALTPSQIARRKMVCGN
jgi:hypothetical protein